MAMKIVTPEQLTDAYEELHPSEKAAERNDVVHVYANWLTRYAENPSKAIATSNWAGKVTKALFHALGLKMPKTKTEMLAVLSA